MLKFSFRLEKLLAYRRQLEQDAKSHYLQAQAKRIDCEHDIEGVARTRTQCLASAPPTLEHRLSLDHYLQRLDDEARMLASALAVLQDEEAAAQHAWFNARREAEALDKLRESEFAEYQLNANRREQAELDEWATTRRAA